MKTAILALLALTVAGLAAPVNAGDLGPNQICHGDITVGAPASRHSLVLGPQDPSGQRPGGYGSLSNFRDEVDSLLPGSSDSVPAEVWKAGTQFLCSVSSGLAGRFVSTSTTSNSLSPLGHDVDISFYNADGVYIWGCFSGTDEVCKVPTGARTLAVSAFHGTDLHTHVTAV